MDPEAFVWLLFLVIWIVSGIVRGIKQVAAQRPGQHPHPGEGERAEQGPRRPERPLPDDDPMVQLLRQLGGEVEVRPHEPPREQERPAEPRAPRQVPPPPPVSRPVPQVASMRSQTVPAVPDVSAPFVPMATGISLGRGASRGRSALARKLRRDLSRPDSLRKAVLLQEILGKPPGLKNLGR